MFSAACFASPAVSSSCGYCCCCCCFYSSSSSPSLILLLNHHHHHRHYYHCGAPKLGVNTALPHAPSRVCVRYNIFDEAIAEVLHVMEVNFKADFERTMEFRSLSKAVEREARELQVLRQVNSKNKNLLTGRV